MEASECCYRFHPLNINDKVMEDNCNCDPMTGPFMVFDGVDVYAEIVQALPLTFQGPDTVLRSNSQMRNDLVEHGVLGDECSRPAMNRNGVYIQGIC
jgi:hypothetical protein